MANSFEYICDFSEDFAAVKKRGERARYEPNYFLKCI